MMTPEAFGECAREALDRLNAMSPDDLHGRIGQRTSIHMRNARDVAARRDGWEPDSPFPKESAAFFKANGYRAATA